MPVFRQSGRAFAAGVSVRPKWLCPESFAASSRAEDSSGGGGGSSISCSLELALTVHSGQVPARLQTNKQSKEAKTFFFFLPLAVATETLYSALSPVPTLRFAFL